MDKFVVLVDSDDALIGLCFDAFGRSPFVGPFASAVSLKEEMSALYPHIKYTVHKLSEALE